MLTCPCDIKLDYLHQTLCMALYHILNQCKIHKHKQGSMTALADKINLMKLPCCHPIQLIAIITWCVMMRYWGRLMHICISKLTITGSDNGLSPGQCHAIIWNNAGILLIWPLGINFSEMLIKILIYSFKKIYLKFRPFCLSLHILNTTMH